MGRKKTVPKKETEATPPPEPVTETTPVDTEPAGVVAEIETEVEAAPAGEQPPEPPPGDDEISKLKEQLAAAQLEASQNLENWQRTAAEMANFKRRQEEQLKLQRDRIKSEVLEGVISALDDMDLAFQNVPQELSSQLLGWVEGFRLVQRKLDRVLDEQNVMTVNSTGKFDPNFHQAISYEDSSDHDTDEIIAELRKGYQIGNRVIRPALVRVAS